MGISLNSKLAMAILRLSDQAAITATAAINANPLEQAGAARQFHTDAREIACRCEIWAMPR